MSHDLLVRRMSHVDPNSDFHLKHGCEGSIMVSSESVRRGFNREGSTDCIRSPRSPSHRRTVSS